MPYEYDFEMVKRAYAEMARRAREKDEVRRGFGFDESSQSPQKGSPLEEQTQAAG